MGIREDFMTVADTAVELLADPAVAASWEKPSALPDYNVGGLAEHLANQVFHIPQAKPSDGPPLSLTEHFAQAVWVGRDASDEMHVQGRRRSEDVAKEGAAALLDRLGPAVEELRTLTATTPEDQIVHLVWTGWDLTFGDFLATRLLELVVHSDDLAVSVGLPTPPVPDSAAHTVADILTRISIRRYGAMPLIRALSRAERAPDTIAAL